MAYLAGVCSEDEKFAFAQDVVGSNGIILSGVSLYRNKSKFNKMNVINFLNIRQLLTRLDTGLIKVSKNV
jgi:hypothetical protein